MFRYFLLTALLGSCLLTLSSWAEREQKTNNLIKNPDFEMVDPQDPALPLNWERWRPSSQTAYLVTGAKSGQRAIKIITSPSTGWQVLEQSIPYEPGAKYSISFDAKTNGIVGGRLDVIDATGGTYVVFGTKDFNETDWNKYKLSFTAPKTSGRIFKVRLYQSDYTKAGGEVFFDNIEMFKIER